MESAPGRSGTNCTGLDTSQANGRLHSSVWNTIRLETECVGVWRWAQITFLSVFFFPTSEVSRGGSEWFGRGIRIVVLFVKHIGSPTKTRVCQHLLA